MNTVFSNIANARITPKSLNKVWTDLFMSSDEVLMTTGYVSNDAVKELHKILEHNQSIQTVKLLVGMHYLEGFSQLQYDSLCELNQFLQQEQRGAVYVSPFVKFHGKMYSFKNRNEIQGLIGSANLTCFWDKTERTYETMFHLEKLPAISLRTDIQTTISKLGKHLEEAKRPDHFRDHNINLAQCLGVQKVSPEHLVSYFEKTSQYKFEIPAKTESKSNLNVFFGDPRVGRKVLPRPWYEVELIIPATIVRQEGYPTNRKIQVITDDGWLFPCYSKPKNKGEKLSTENFRSENDLKTLGKWIKGRLESANCLKTGEKINEETLRKYGNDHFEFRSTDNPDIWLLSFKGKN